MVKARATRNVLSVFEATDFITRTYTTDVLGIKYPKAIINPDKDTLKLTRKNTQEESINKEINARDCPKNGVHTLAALDRVALLVTWLANMGMAPNVDLINRINLVEGVKNCISI